MKDVKVKGLSRRAEAEKYRIPRSTLRDYVNGKSTKRCGGPSTVLTYSDEQEIVVACQTLQQFGFSMTTDIVEMIVKEYVISTDSPHHFGHGGIPGHDWWHGFFRWWPCLSRRKLPRNRAQGSWPEVSSTAVILQVIDKWFQHF